MLFQWVQVRIGVLVVPTVCFPPKAPCPVSSYPRFLQIRGTTTTIFMSMGGREGIKLLQQLQIPHFLQPVVIPEAVNQWKIGT